MTTKEKKIKIDLDNIKLEERNNGVILEAKHSLALKFTQGEFDTLFLSFWESEPMKQLREDVDNLKKVR